MVILFNQRVSFYVLLELVLSALVLFAAFSGVAAILHPNLVTNSGGATPAAFVFAAVQLLSIGAFGLHRQDRTQSPHALVAKFCLSLLLGAIACMVIFGALPNQGMLRTTLPNALILSALGLGLIRLLLASGLQTSLLAHRVLVLGTGLDAAAVERVFPASARAGVTLVGFYPIDNSETKVISSDRLLSNASSLEATVGRMGVHEVIVAVREQRGGMLPLSELLSCRLRGVRVTDMSAFFERVTGEVPVDSLKASWLIYGEGFRQGLARRMIKRTFDIAAATVLLIVAAPIMLAAAIAICFETGRPIILRQERVGLGGRTFPLLKFRSMRIDAEKDGVPKWASSGDHRITRVGRFLRRSRIDELPQIFNVLRGEMSFVGPRPERPYFVEQLSEQVPFYGARHTVKPGLTGWAQVRYSYGASIEDAVRKLQYDLYYIKNHTLVLDLMVLFKTVKVVLGGEGAR